MLTWFLVHFDAFMFHDDLLSHIQFECILYVHICFGSSSIKSSQARPNHPSPIPQHPWHAQALLGGSPKPKHTRPSRLLAAQAHHSQTPCMPRQPRQSRPSTRRRGSQSCSRRSRRSTTRRITTRQSTTRQSTTRHTQRGQQRWGHLGFGVPGSVPGHQHTVASKISHISHMTRLHQRSVISGISRKLMRSRRRTRLIGPPKLCLTQPRPGHMGNLIVVMQSSLLGCLAICLMGATAPRPSIQYATTPATRFGETFSF